MSKVSKVFLALLVWLALSVPVGIAVSRVLKARREEMEAEAKARQELQGLQARPANPVHPLRDRKECQGRKAP